MFIPQNNSFCVKVCKLQYLQNSTFKHKNKRDQFDIFCDGWDEDKGDIPDIRKSKAGLLCIFWTFTASLHMHKNEAWIRTYIFCNITFVKWVNTELFHVTKPIWLHWMQFYAWRKNITEAIGVKSHWKFRQARSCHNRNGLKQ